MTRKLLLFLFALAIGFSSAAQKANRHQAQPKEHASVIPVGYVENEFPTSTTSPSIPFPREIDGVKTVSKTLIGSARNIFGGLLSFQTCLTYNYDLGTILFTHRGNDKGTTALLGTGNDVITAFSQDEGSVFTQSIALSNGLGNRYCSGDFYNPTGNNDITNAYTLVAGPITTSSVWSHVYLHSGKYDGTGQNHQEFATDPTYLELIRNGLTATSDGKFHISTIGNTNDGTYFLTGKLFDMNGTWNTATNQVDWEPKGEIPLNLVTAPSNNRVYMDGSYSQAAWSKDGSVGYLMTIAADNRPSEKPTYAPMIWKSIDGGTTWTMLDYFDWSSLTAITDWIFPTKYDTTVYKPFFEEASIVVDANDKPHIFGLVRGGYSADLDSLGYIYVRASTGTIMDGNIVELYLDDSDVWQGLWIDSISADAVSPDESPYVNDPDNTGWDHRLSAGISEDGTKVFCTWTDSDWIFWGTEPYILNPDLKGWGRDIWDTDYVSPVENFTAETDLWGLAFFHHMSPKVISTPDGFEIPITITDINTSGLQAQEPVYYYYVKGCKLWWPIGINEQSSRNHITASPCYPNPFNGTTQVNVTVSKPVSVSISIYNITGQLISTTDHGTLNAGRTTLTIDGSKLLPGVYLYTINAGDQSFNNKMVVK